MRKSIPELPKGFDQFVSLQIQPLFDALKIQRAKGYSLLYKYGGIGACIGLTIGVWLYFSQPKIWPVSLVLVIVGMVLGMIPGWIKLADAKNHFGKEHVGKVAAFLGLTHQAEQFEPPRFETFNQLGLVALGDRRTFSHLISGTHDDSKFCIYQGKIEERRTRTVSDGKNGTRTETYWVTVFDGQLLHSPYPRKFACTTIIARDHGWFNFKTRFGKAMKPMGLADPKFEKLFEVYTTDQVEGRFLVDPIFMTRLLELEANHKIRKTTAAFFEQGVFVALAGGTQFFGKLDNKATAASLASETVTAFLQIFHFLDMLKGKKK